MRRSLSPPSWEDYGFGPASACRAGRYGSDNGNETMALKRDLTTSGGLNQLDMASADQRREGRLRNQRPLPKDSNRGVTGRNYILNKLSNKIDFLIRNSLKKETDFMVARIMQGIRESGYDHTEGICKKPTHTAKIDGNLEYLNRTKLPKPNLDFEKNEGLLMKDEIGLCQSEKPCPCNHVINEDLTPTKNNQSATERVNQFEDMNLSPQSPKFGFINGFDLNLLNDQNTDLNFLDHNPRGDLTNHMDIDQEDFLSADNGPHLPCGEAFDNMLFEMLNEVDGHCNDKINNKKQEINRDYEDFGAMNETSITKDSENLNNLDKNFPIHNHEDLSAMNETSITKDSKNLNNLEKIFPTHNLEDLSAMNETSITKDSENLSNLEKIITTHNNEDLSAMNDISITKDSEYLGNLEKSIPMKTMIEEGINKDSEDLTNLEIHTKIFEDLCTLDETNTAKDSDNLGFL